MSSKTQKTTLRSDSGSPQPAPHKAYWNLPIPSPFGVVPEARRLSPCSLATADRGIRQNLHFVKGN
ncbi:MAG: hypothetical protein KDA45_08765, partial [Planctomycetales bacterium]|nr:hypothetical protein [Planctomycetales bacterium]